MNVFREKPGIISTGAIWVCISDGYLYTDDTLSSLLDLVLTEWKHVRHLVG